MSRIIGFFGVLVFSLALSTEARAEDWSQFVDNTPQKPLIKVTGPSKAAPAPAARPTKTVAAKPKATAKLNARAKSKTRR